VLDRQGQQLSRIVEDLIDVTRIVEKKIELRKERVALRSVVDMALETCRSRIDGYRHRLTVNLPSEPLFLDADPARLAQVFVNLLDNATKYTPPGGEIWLTAERAAQPLPDGDTGQVLVRVRDTGIGIAADLLPRVFDIFTQGARSTDQGRGGLGVGLTLVRSFVQMHGGSVEAHSAGPQQGSEFVVRLPLAAGPPERATETRPAPRPIKQVLRRILVVDDNRDQVETTAVLLRLMGDEVRTAENGPDSLQVAAEFRPEVVLVDIGLPGMNGYEVAQRLREQPHLRGSLLIAQTGWGQEDDRRRSEEAGFNHHLVKPVPPETIEKLLASLPPKR
jgi:CheY-like chemotaxis protein/two-component sensor histidine kinase